MRTRTERRRLVGAMLRDLRHDAGFRQADIATRLGRPQSYVSKYEAGEQSLDLIEVADICDALGTDLVAFSRRLLDDRQTKG